MILKIQILDSMPSDFEPKVGISATYVNVNGKLLFLKRAAANKEQGLWGVPAGKLEARETPLIAAKRELLEETGIDISVENFQSFGTLYMRKPELDYFYHFFGINLSLQPPVKLSEEHSAFTWANSAEIEELHLMLGAREALHFYCLRSASYIE